MNGCGQSPQYVHVGKNTYNIIDANNIDVT